MSPGLEINILERGSVPMHRDQTEQWVKFYLPVNSNLFTIWKNEWWPLKWLLAVKFLCNNQGNYTSLKLLEPYEEHDSNNIWLSLLLLLLLLLLFWDRVLLYSPGTHYINQVGLELTEIYLPVLGLHHHVQHLVLMVWDGVLGVTQAGFNPKSPAQLPECWDSRHVSPCWAKPMSVLK